MFQNYTAFYEIIEYFLAFALINDNLEEIKIYRKLNMRFTVLGASNEKYIFVRVILLDNSLSFKLTYWNYM